MAMTKSFLIVYLFTVVNACKTYVQLEPNKYFHISNANVIKGCEYEIYTTNQYSINTECRVGGCLKGLHIYISLEGYSMNPLAYSCETVSNHTSYFQRVTIKADINIDFECNLKAVKSQRKWGWSRNPKDIDNQRSNIFEFPFFVAQVYIPTKTIFCGGSISKFSVCP